MLKSTCKPESPGLGKLERQGPSVAEKRTILEDGTLQIFF